ncbi:von Willebrand factor type A [Desulfatibacillum aliphaticivorans]|uniref:von Willebrand factor type A n=1 Tax=Desulfatibacillum aliphaticivorans TaxID=218208 RepID=B8FBV4_DESAL|nr:VWA domain-containing protein [Desulfatibacillum aliphaticivorans]ACL05159.1 von Willebrand factor type A [Desulfatibacillum aliphaticivorans]
MTFDKLWILNFLLAIPLLVFLQILAKRRRRKSLAAYADEHLLPRLAPLESRARAVVRAVMFISAVALMVFALAGPQWGEHYQEVSRKGVDIMVCVDISNSMMVEDAQPNRLERAKREVADLIRVATGDRLGLVAFSGVAFTQCPLTLDYQAIQMFLDQLTVDLLPLRFQGTDLGAAIEMGMTAFDPKSSTDKVILLITDGEDNEEAGLKAAEKASDEGIRIFVLGIGDPAGGPVPSLDGSGFEKDAGGKIILSKPDESTLQAIANETGGDYIRSEAGDFDLDQLYFNGIKKKTEAEILKTGKITIREERFFIFLIAAWALLLIEGVLRERILDIRA